MSEALDLLCAELQRGSHDEVHRLLLDHGTAFEPADPPNGLSVPKSRSCYFNAFRIATAEPERFTYYEGVGTTWYYDGNEATELSLSAPTSHAWCVDRAWQGRRHVAARTEERSTCGLPRTRIAARCGPTLGVRGLERHVRQSGIRALRPKGASRPGAVSRSGAIGPPGM